MTIRIYETTYKNVEAIAIESNRLVVTMIPSSGSKLQSIYDKMLQKEYLIQSPSKEFVRSAYASNFAEGDVSGFDEIFPSIESCFYPLEPWEGVSVPDHGEVWSLPWQYNVLNNSIVLRVHGVRFPYRLEKKIEFLREQCFRITYKAENLSDFDFPFIWTPHMLLQCEADSVIVLPDSVKNVISTCSVDNKLGKFGTMHTWPITRINEEAYDISQVYPKYPGKCEKYYAMGNVLEGWCALHNKGTGSCVGLSYPIDKVPYLGIWEGIMNGRFVTALEPCTGDLDSLDTAVQWNRVSVIKAKSHIEWYLNITFDTVERIHFIDQDGFIK